MAIPFLYKIGDKVIVLDNREGNRFSIGSEVTITQHRSIYKEEPFYKCKDDCGREYDVMEKSILLVPPKVFLPDSLFEL